MRTKRSGARKLNKIAPFGLLQRRIFSELAFLFSLCAGSLLTLLLIGRMLQLRDLFLTQDLSFFDLGRLFFYLSPFFLLLIIPIGCMLSVFLTFLRMGTDRELIALRTSGLSLYQLLPAPLAFCLLCLAFNALISFHGLAWGMNQFRDTVLDLARTKTQLVLQPGVFNTDFPGLTIFAKNVDRARGELNTVFVRDSTRENITATILAPKGRVATDREHGEIVFLLENGRIYRQEKQGVGVLGFDEYTVRMDLSKLVRGYDVGEVKPKEMSWERLNELSDSPDTAEEFGGNFARKVDVEVHKRMSLPWACLVLGIFAIPLSTVFQGLSRQWGLLLALGFFMLYYTLLSIGLTMGEAGTLSPSIGLWLPNVFFLGAGAAGFKLAVSERSINVMSRIRHLDLLRRRGHAH
jgi:lipopolysaccharide export system permease protein